MEFGKVAKRLHTDWRMGYNDVFLFAKSETIDLVAKLGRESKKARLLLILRPSTCSALASLFMSIRIRKLKTSGKGVGDR